MPIDKALLRREMTVRRRALAAADAARAAQAVADHFLATFDPSPGAVIAAYLPIGAELDTAPLVAGLRARGVTVALPVVVVPDTPLEFRVWAADGALETGSHGIAHPDRRAKRVVPDWVLTPLLAFDPKGYRLGYGGGYYDRTLAALRGAGSIRAIGLAYSAQAATLIVEPHDQPLDAVVTENGVMTPGMR